MRRGFTLIELAVTLLVLGLASAFVAPAIGRGLDNLRARAEVSGFAAFLRAAREQAVIRGEVQQVRVDPESRTLALWVEGSKSASSSRSFSYLVSIEPDPPTVKAITFRPQGLSTGGRFLLEAPGRRRYVVTVDTLTGRVSTRLAES